MNLIQSIVSKECNLCL